MQMMSAAEVAERLLEMGYTIKRLHVRGCFPATYKSAMPDPLRTPEELFGAVRQRIGELEALYKSLGITVSQERLTREAYDMEKPFPDPPTAQEISRMDEAMQWVHYVTHSRQKVMANKRRTMWLKASGLRTKRIAKMLGVNRDTVVVWWNEACQDIANALSNRSQRAA